MPNYFVIGLADGNECDNRKNNFPVGEVRVRLLFIPSLAMLPLGHQVADVKSWLCSNLQVVEGYGQRTFTLLRE